MTDLTFERLLGNEKHRVIYRAVWGSHAFGTATPASDRDTLGVFVMEKAHYLISPEPLRQLSDERCDNRFYTLKNFLELAAGANPNILDLLFIPGDCILRTTPYWGKIAVRRELFVSRQAAKSYCEYAFAQIKKAKGCNKRVHNPAPPEPPEPEDFCRFLPLDGGGAMPGRPVALKSVGIDLKEFHVSAVENSAGLFRLYHYGPAAKGVFRNGMPVCQSIPLEDEKPRFAGLLIFNQDAFEHAKSQHRQYGEWRRNRNESRWQAQERGILDYDAKSMMHTLRLLYSGLNIMREGAPLVRFSGEKLAELLAVRRGEFSYAALIAKAEELAAELASLRENSSLPENADRREIGNLLLEITDMWEHDNA